MSIATGVTWGLNFCVTMTLPVMIKHIRESATYGFYSAWCFVGIFLVLLYVYYNPNLDLVC